MIPVIALKTTLVIVALVRLNNNGIVMMQTENHLRLYEHINIEPFLEEINYNNDWIAGNDKLQPKVARISLIVAHRNPGDIKTFWGGIPTKSGDSHSSQNYTGVRPTKIFKKYNHTSSFLGWFKDVHKCKIARVRYAKLDKGDSVPGHIDTGSYYANKNRFHLVIKGKYLYTVGGETKEYKEGEIWWFDNKKTHGTYNHGEEDSIRLIFDAGFYNNDRILRLVEETK